MSTDKHCRLVCTATVVLLVLNLLYSLLIARGAIDQSLWWVMITLSLILSLPWITLQCYWSFNREKGNGILLILTIRCL